MARDEKDTDEAGDDSEAYPDAGMKFGDEKAAAKEYKNSLTETTLEALKGITCISRRAQRGTLTFEDASYLKAVSLYMKPVFDAAIPLIIKKFGIAVAKQLQDKRSKRKELFEDPLEQTVTIGGNATIEVIQPREMFPKKKKDQIAGKGGLE